MIHQKISLYEGREDVNLTTYVLDDSAEMLDGGKRGAVLVCPGGAYLYCSDREGEPVAMAFANMGYHAFVLRYSVYNENKGKNTLSNIMPAQGKPWIKKEQLEFPGPMRDIGKAMLYIREHADDWNLDVDKIVLCGFSAGAHNCAMYSVYYNRPIITDFLGITEGIRPAGAVLGYTLSNYHILADSEVAGAPLFRMSMMAFAGEERVNDNTLTDFSPSMLVNETTPPMFLWATDDDQVVESRHSLLMACALAEKKIPYEIHIFERGAHGMSLATQATASGKEQIRNDIAVWIQMADTWLKKRMAIEIPEKKTGL